MYFHYVVVSVVYEMVTQTSIKTIFKNFKTSTVTVCEKKKASTIITYCNSILMKGYKIIQNIILPAKFVSYFIKLLVKERKKVL